jgi:protein-tyrosine kinase
MERIKEAIRLAKEYRSTLPNAAQVPNDRRSAMGNPAQGLPAEPQPQPIALELLVTNKSHLEATRTLSEKRGNAYVAAFDMLRTRILNEMESNGWQMLLVTSPTAECGKTVTAINLALSMSRHQEQHVVLIDLDLRKPRVASYLGVTPPFELHQVLKGEVHYRDALFGVDFAGPRLSFLVNTLPMNQPVEALLSRQMNDVLIQLRAAEPKAMIIVDMPPLLVSDDVLAFLPLADCSILAVAEDQSTVKEVQNSEKTLSGSNFMGCVLTKSKTQVQSYY